MNGSSVPLGIRSIVGVIPLFAVEVLDEDTIDRLPGFRKRMQWFLENRPDLARHISYCECSGAGDHRHRLLAIPSRDRLTRVLRYVLDEKEFLSPHGIRALSRFHKDNPYVFEAGGEEHRVDNVPGESNTGLFGGNSNWRGPIWFPVNYLLVEALQRYHHFYGDTRRRFVFRETAGGGRHLCNSTDFWYCHGSDRRVMRHSENQPSDINSLSLRVGLLRGRSPSAFDSLQLLPLSP